MKGSPPLRFLAIVLGGWAGVRAALLVPSWPTPPTQAVAAHGPARTVPQRKRRPEPGRIEGAVARIDSPSLRVFPAAGRAPPIRLRSILAVRPPAAAPPLPGEQVAPASVAPLSTPGVLLLPPPGPAGAGRWALSAWSFVRRGGSAGLAAGGLLGGSQAGARLTYRLNRDTARPLALSVRLSTALGRPAGAEAALGLDWRPLERFPVHFLAERRQALGREGRSAFGLTLHGGVSDARLGPFRVDSYAQAGIVGARSRDLFGDGSIRLSVPLGRDLRVGAGSWAAAQPGLSRLDLGPQAALRLPVAGHAMTLAADWRLRAAGNAAPGSGPTLTLTTDF